ncbi:MAG: reverse transcriptase-like protein [Actinomycetota bacterium]|nr:reverse transcriptase-like protein [Actinomycetota bacterium]
MPAEAQGAYRLFTDGGARGNPGPAGLGAVLVAPDGSVLREVARGIGWATNNVAEYQGLIEGLLIAQAFSVDELNVFMDSRLVVEQMRGNFKVKHPGLKPLHEKARELAASFKRIRFHAIPRSQNVHADRLTNRGIDEWVAENPGFGPPDQEQPGLF